MDTLKNIIKENEAMFNEYRIPEGDTARFLDKLDRSGIEVDVPRKKINFRRFALPVAAVLILCMGVGIFMNVAGGESEMTKIYIAYCQEVANLSTDIQMMTMDEDMKMANRTVDNITFEAIPLASQLPEEMPERERLKIMKEYYTQKLEGVRRLKNLISDFNINEDCNYMRNLNN